MEKPLPPNPKRVLDYLTIALGVIATSIILISIPQTVGAWPGTIFIVSFHLLLALALFRQTYLPFRYQLPFLMILCLVIGFSCVYPFTLNTDHASRYYFGIAGGSPRILLIFPISILTTAVITFTAWGSLRTLLTTKRPQWLPQLSWIVPVFYATTLLLLDAYLLWPSVKIWLGLS